MNDDLDRYYVPPARMTTLDFLKQILAKQKLLLKLEQVRFVTGAERYTELSLNALIEYANIQMRDLFNYLPSNPVPAKLDRNYVLNVSCE